MALLLRGLTVLGSAPQLVACLSHLYPPSNSEAELHVSQKIFRLLVDIGVPSLNSVFGSHIGKAISNLGQTPKPHWTAAFLPHWCETRPLVTLCLTLFLLLSMRCSPLLSWSGSFESSA